MHSNRSEEETVSNSRQVELLWKAGQDGGVETHSMKVSSNDEELLRFERKPRAKGLAATFINAGLVSEAQAEEANTERQKLHRWLKERAWLTLNAALPGSRLVDFVTPEAGELDDLDFDAWLQELLSTAQKLPLHAFARHIDSFRGEVQSIIRLVRSNLEADLKNMAYHEPLRPVPKRIEKGDKDDPALVEWWRLASNHELLTQINDWFASNPHTKRHRLIFDLLLPVSKYSDLVAQLGGEISADQALEAALAAKIESEGLCEEHIYGNGIWDDDNPSMCDFASKEEALNASYDYLMDDGKYGWKHFSNLVASEDLDSALDFVLSGVNALKKTYARRLEAPWKHLERADIYFEDVATKTKIPPSNLGVGFSQMVPFVSSALSSDNRLIVIEQPELHVHPALQTELADLFIQSAKERGNRFLIETHSEHLILRVMRRIRETTRNSLPEGKPPIKPEDVAILYVQPGENGSTVLELRIDEQGRFRDNWPQGFFEDRLDEMF
jgi:hypothetical protein